MTIVIVAYTFFNPAIKFFGFVVLEISYFLEICVRFVDVVINPIRIFAEYEFICVPLSFKSPIFVELQDVHDATNFLKMALFLKN